MAFSGLKNPQQKPRLKIGKGKIKKPAQRASLHSLLELVTGNQSFPAIGIEVFTFL